MKAIIACGGTSGHINPAISIADEIKRREPDSEILFIGTENKLEADLVPRAGYPIEFIEIRGLSREKSLKGIADNIKTLDKFMRAKRRVKKIIKEFCPDVVIGTGGYVSAPVLSEAESLKCKTVIHEQNAFAGVTTKMLAKKSGQSSSQFSFGQTAFLLCRKVRGCRKSRKSRVCRKKQGRIEKKTRTSS